MAKTGTKRKEMVVKTLVEPEKRGVEIGGHKLYWNKWVKKNLYNVEEE